MERIRNAASQQELMNSFRDFGRSVVDLTDKAGRRQMVRLLSLLLMYKCLYRKGTLCWKCNSRLNTFRKRYTEPFSFPVFVYFSLSVLSCISVSCGTEFSSN